MLNDDIPRELPVPVVSLDRDIPIIHPLFRPVPRPDIRVEPIRAGTTVYDWAPGFRGTRLQVKTAAGGVRQGMVQLLEPSTLLTMLSLGMLTGQAEKDAGGLEAISREYLRVIYANEIGQKARLLDVLERVKEKKLSLEQARAEVELAPDVSEAIVEAIVAGPETVADDFDDVDIKEDSALLTEGMPPILTDGWEHATEEEELDRALETAEASEEMVPEEFRELLFEPQEAEPPEEQPAPKPKKRRRRQK